MKLKKYYFGFFLILLPVLLISCYNDYGLNTSDFDVAISFRDNNVNFQDYRTYAMPDSVVRMAADNNSSPNTTYDQTILNEIETQMNAYGYTRIDPDTNNLPDVILLAGVTSSDNYAVSGGNWWGWWGWYPGWEYYPGYGTGWYPSYGYAYSYTTGTLVITMIDPVKTDISNKSIAVIWSGALNGVLGTSTSDNRVRIIDGIDKIFEQSPYLRIYK